MGKRRVNVLTATGSGSYEVRLPESHRELLAALAEQLRDLLTEGHDPALRRLFPVAYTEDADREADYQSLMHDDLLRKRLEDLDLLEQLGETSSLDEEEVVRMMQALNSVRLVLGTRLDVAEDMERPPPDAPEAPGYELYEYLGWLLEAFLDGLR